VKNEEDAIEIVNDAFLAVWDKKEYLTLDNNLRAYLYKTVKNKSLNFIQKKKLLTNDVEEEIDLDSSYPSPFEILEFKEAQKILDALIDELPDRCKQIFLLSRKEGMSHKEIAEIMDISTKTIENQIGIAIKIIRAGFAKSNKSALLSFFLF
jgi:RNA polymerase sigma-70 factor, ECF subfamily